jgi:hypothetical protein
MVSGTRDRNASKPSSSSPVPCHLSPISKQDWPPALSKMNSSLPGSSARRRRLGGGSQLRIEVARHPPDRYVGRRCANGPAPPDCWFAALALGSDFSVLAETEPPPRVLGPPFAVAASASASVRRNNVNSSSSRTRHIPRRPSLSGQQWCCEHIAVLAGWSRLQRARSRCLDWKLCASRLQGFDSGGDFHAVISR